MPNENPMTNPPMKPSREEREEKYWKIEKKYNLMLDNQNYDDLFKAFDEIRQDVIQEVLAKMEYSEYKKDGKTFAIYTIDPMDYHEWQDEKASYNPPPL